MARSSDDFQPLLHPLPKTGCMCTIAKSNGAFYDPGLYFWRESYRLPGSKNPAVPLLMLETFFALNGVKFVLHAAEYGP